MHCGCESLACKGIHQMGSCPVEPDKHSPTMLYVGKVCEGCAQRISDNGGASYLKWDKS